MNPILTDYAEKCDYLKIKNRLREKGFVKLLEGHQNVWINLRFLASNGEMMNTNLQQVRIELMPGKTQFLQLSQLRVLDTANNLIKPLLVNASIPVCGSCSADVAHDGVAAARPFPSIYHSMYNSNVFYEFIIPNIEIGSIEIYNRTDDCSERMADFILCVKPACDDRIKTSIKLNKEHVQIFKSNRVQSRQFTPA